MHVFEHRKQAIEFAFYDRHSANQVIMVYSSRKKKTPQVIWTLNVKYRAQLPVIMIQKYKPEIGRLQIHKFQISSYDVPVPTVAGNQICNWICVN